MSPSYLRPTATIVTALQLGVVHMFVDLATGFVAFRDVATLQPDHAAAVAAVVLYNALAFGTQFLLGLAADRWHAYRPVAVGGVALLTTGLLIASQHLWVGVVLLGIGNAMFHVGAGAHVLRISGSRSAASGVFIGPGVVGLTTGLLLGLTDVAVRLPLAAVLLAGGTMLLRWTRPLARRAPALPRIQAGLLSLALLAGLCLVGSVLLRALVGGTVVGPWRAESTVVWATLAVAACAGKMSGGFLGDRLGWARTSVLALAVSAPLVSVWGGIAATVIPGVLLFTMTTAMTLKGLHHVLPDRPGLAFGLPTLALFLGHCRACSGTVCWTVRG